MVALQIQVGIERELGGKLCKYFSDVDTFPLASATIAQVLNLKI
jgi:predicted unusual protein kinase regulating ubiquinone biosynthesis (AarF/ABC1/UbiB family)